MRPLLAFVVVVGSLAAIYAALNMKTRELDENITPPASVPRAAVWAGGPDGGAWILVRPTSESRIWDGQVYYQAGELWAKGKFWGRDVEEKYIGKAALPLDSFDGTTIYIVGSVPLYPIGRHEYPVGNNRKMIIEFPNPGSAYESEARHAKGHEVPR